MRSGEWSELCGPLREAGRPESSCALSKQVTRLPNTVTQSRAYIPTQAHAFTQILIVTRSHTHTLKFLVTRSHSSTPCYTLTCTDTSTQSHTLTPSNSQSHVLTSSHFIVTSHTHPGAPGAPNRVKHRGYAPSMCRNAHTHIHTNSHSYTFSRTVTIVSHTHSHCSHTHTYKDSANSRDFVPPLLGHHQIVYICESVFD